jgi:hypothetical protein
MVSIVLLLEVAVSSSVGNEDVATYAVVLEVAVSTAAVVVAALVEIGTASAS